MEAFVIRLLSLLPTVGIVVYMMVAQIQDFRLEIMRPLSLFFLLVMGPILYFLKQQDRASVIEKAMFGYIVLSALGFWFWPDGLGRFLGSFRAASLYAVVFVAVAVPPLVGREPFTERFARRKTPPEVWQTGIFKRINHHMTWAWTAIFAVCGLVALAPDIIPGLDTRLAGILFRIVLPMAFLLGVGLPLNKYYPDYY